MCRFFGMYVYRMVKKIGFPYVTYNDGCESCCELSGSELLIAGHLVREGG